MIKLNINKLNNKQLLKLSQQRLLALNLQEMLRIKNYFKKENRPPTDAELETLAQAWSEHCRHKIFNAKIIFYHNGKRKIYNNLIKETIFKVTADLNKKWCLSVFKDNAGIIEFDKKYAVCFKVETHNHPSALEPYGGAGTGIGGVIRDILGCGKGAKPILNIDVFCFAFPDYPMNKLPKKIIHPKRIFYEVVAGVRDYGNRMGIPTSCGAIFFDNQFLMNPLVYCGTVGIMKKKFIEKNVKPGDLIVVIGGKTGRDGIHGATFSSQALHKELQSSVVQIGNPIEEKKFLDALLVAQSENLYNSITDCGAGGISNAITELGSKTGAEVNLEKLPLKYEGLSPWEIWVSESQERMVLAVPEQNFLKLKEIFESENSHATVIGKFTDSKKIKVFYNSNEVVNLDSDFIVNGYPKKTLKAIFNSKKFYKPKKNFNPKFPDIVYKVLQHPNIASKEWVIRQYDHEVQGLSVIKPFAGGEGSSPQDACVIKPLYNSNKGLVISCGINPYYGEFDPFYMAGCVIEETLRNIIACGGGGEGNLKKIALLDNFCWGDVDNPQILGELVRCVEGCYYYAKKFNTPFISGKDSLFNTYKIKNKKKSIPPTLLISGISVIDDVRKTITTEFKYPDNPIFIVGITKDEFAGSILSKVLPGCPCKSVPKVDADKSLLILNKLQKAIQNGCIYSCHDISDGGLAVSLIEMSFGNFIGAEVDLNFLPHNNLNKTWQKLFSESQSRFLIEVKRDREKDFKKIMQNISYSQLGITIANPKIIIKDTERNIIFDEKIEDLYKVWRQPLNLN